jgi:ascorbate-specific PTS system EIIC-type component UlaA
MHFVFESLFVGIYSMIIFVTLKYFKLNNVLFLTGFMKHFLGNILQLHTYYCNYGDSCIENRQLNQQSNTTITILIAESILEGIMFVIIGSMFNNINRNITEIQQIFLIGILLHNLAEIIGVHKFFCNNRCIKK